MLGLVGTVVDAAIGWLVQSILGSFFTAQMEAWTCEIGLVEDVKKLKSEMTTMEMVLAASEGRKIGNKPLAQSVNGLRELLYDAEDVMDELDYYRLQQQIEQGKVCSAAAGNNPESNYASSSTPFSPYQLVCSARSQITSWVSSVRKRKREEEEPTDSTMLPLEIKRDISKRINGIVNNLQKTRNSVQGFLQLEISCLAFTSNQRQSVTRNTRLTTSVPVEPKVYGRDADRDRIIELLINEGSSDLCVLPIVGTGGIGKTTLVRFVYRDQRVIDHFDLQMRICVSTNFNEVRLTVEILEHVCKDTKEYRDVSNFNVLQEIFLKNIGDKRFLLILDDMWEDKDGSGWDKLLAPLKCNRKTGCMVVATTRRNSVAQMIGTVNAFQISGLDEKEFWLFFKACAFGNENHEGHCNLQSIGQQIAKSLKGCPLAARSVGALLFRNLSYEHWRTVQDKWKSLQVKDDDIIPILKLSYDYLPFHLQRCFSYCSLFPEDHRLYRETLVQTWISQNFVQCEDTGKGLEETGMQYLDSLVDFGFFQKSDSHYAMHDLMHDLAEQVSSNECATINGLQPEIIRPSIRHLSIITTGHDENASVNFSSVKFEHIVQKIRPLHKLRSLMFFGESSVKLLKSIRTLCEEAKCLRLLRVYISSADISSIYNLLKPFHLRYLEFICVHTTYRSAYELCEGAAFPRALTSFYHLQVLNVGMSGIFATPTGMNNLVNLRHLIAHDKVQCSIACVGTMTSLQELKFKVQNVGGFEVRQLQSMNELVVLGIYQLGNVKTKEEASGARLIDKGYLKELSLSWDGGSMSLEPERTKEVLEGLKPHQNLKTLRMTGYNGPTSPTWLSCNLSVTSLQKLHLENCREWRILRSLEILPLLKELKLIRMCNLVEISIPSLEVFVLIELPQLEKCVGSYGKGLTSHLRVLMLSNCPRLNEFTIFQSRSAFEAEQKSWFPSLYKLTIRRCHYMGKWETLPLREMRALKELELMDLHAVRELSVPSLKKLVLIKLPNLISWLTGCSPLQEDQKEGPSTGRHELYQNNNSCTGIIRDCPSLIVSPVPSYLISNLSIKGMPHLPTMEIRNSNTWLTIESNSLSVLDEKIIAFHNLRCITTLEIKDCPNLISLSIQGFSQLIALESLFISNSPNLLRPRATPEEGQEDSTSTNSLVFPSLLCVDIRSCGITGRWLTQMLQHVRSLELLSLSECPHIRYLSINQPAETEGSNSSSSTTTAVASLAQEELMLRLSSSVIPSLGVLHISECRDLELCGGKGGFEVFTSLKHLEIQGCPNLASSLVGSMLDSGLVPPLLYHLSISCLPATLQSYYPKSLTCINDLLLGSSYLKCVRLHSCMFLEILTIECQQLAVLEGLESLKSLQRLNIEMNPELSTAWDFKLLPISLSHLDVANLTDRDESRMLSILPQIIELGIRNSPELTFLQLGCCTALKQLRITCCESLASIVGFQAVVNLRHLNVLKSPSLSPCLGLLSQHLGASEIWSRLETFHIDDPSVLTTSLCKHLTSL